MLQNAYLLAKIGADTAENERKFAENLPKIGNYPTGAQGDREDAPGPGGLGHLGFLLIFSANFATNWDLLPISPCLEQIE
jgi:hypothetical protein